MFDLIKQILFPLLAIITVLCTAVWIEDTLSGKRKQ